MLGRLLPRDDQFFTLFDQLAGHLATTAKMLDNLFGDARHVSEHVRAIKDIEHKADLLTTTVNQRIDKSFITPIDREDIHDLATRLDDVLDFIEAAAERLVVYRIKEPTSAARALSEVIVQQTLAMDRTIKCLRTLDPGFHEHAVEVNRLENSADALLRDSLAALFEEQGDPIEVIKWKEIYETMETVTDRCEDVANVIEGIILKMA
jgi:predicted phosphate transport protein (TIGR00153 family)